ncbi:B3 domain-containing protein REM5-like [Henckelia pumila]|uniref:B3 domain-containing protein REM5-like n=1 Tax=Henckelia pumila TaxID=405737 RepID=UPI003C6E54AF
MELERLSKPSFFKVLFNECFTRQLRLPTAFVQKHGEMLAENAVLRGSSGKCWAVKLEHSGDEECYFKVGWPKFAEDWGLRMGEFLVFWLAGKSTFDVWVFGINGCQRELISNSDSHEQVHNLHTHHAQVSNKRRNTSVLEKEAARSPPKVDLSSPLYFEIVLKKYHKSRVGLGMKFAKASGLISQDRVVLEYVPKHHFTAVALHPNTCRVDMSWSSFRQENGLIIGRTYSFQFNPSKNVIQVCDKK